MKSPLYDRREFIKTSGIAAATAVSMPAILKSQTESKKKLRLGIVGCGGRSNNVIDNALADGRYEIVSLADYFQDQVDRQGEKYGVPEKMRFTGLKCHEKLIDAGNIDVLAVLSPPYFHPDQVEAGVDAGLHIWLAKPIAVDTPGVKRIEKLAAKSAKQNKCFFIDFQTRAFAHFHEAARRVAAGDIGELRYGEIEASCAGFKLRAPHTSKENNLKNWLQWKALCGESIVEYSVHAIDVASLFIGRPPVSATGQTGRNFLDGLSEPVPGDVQDLWIVEYDYGNGFKMHFRGKRFDQNEMPELWSNHVTLFGLNGGLYGDYEGEVYIRGEKSFNGDRFMKEKIRGIYDRGIQVNLNTFYNDVINENFAQETVAPSIESHYLALLGREAAYANGKTVTWEDIVNSKEVLELDTEGLKA